MFLNDVSAGHVFSDNVRSKDGHFNTNKRKLGLRDMNLHRNIQKLTTNNDNPNVSQISKPVVYDMETENYIPPSMTGFIIFKLYF